MFDDSLSERKSERPEKKKTENKATADRDCDPKTTEGAGDRNYVRIDDLRREERRFR